jgi:spermidine/putrescine-binding protein
MALLRLTSVVSSLALAAALAACGTPGMSMDKGMMAPQLKLTGDQEVPANTSTAVGTGSFTVAADGSVSGSVSAPGMAGMAAHIHVGAAGVNGPVIIPLTGSAGDTWTVPAGAKLTDEQMAAYKAGNLYVNIHTAEHKGGELRAQLKP